MSEVSATNYRASRNGETVRQLRDVRGVVYRLGASETPPTGDTITRAESTPFRLVSRFSARLTPHGSG